MIALWEIYHNVCHKVPGNPLDIIFPEAEGGESRDILLVKMLDIDTKF